MAENFQALVVRELIRFFEPVANAETPAGRRQLLAEIGWDLDAISGFPVTDLESAFQAVAAALEGLTELDGPPETFDDLVTVLEIADDVRKALKSFPKLLDETAIPKPPDFELLAEDLLGLLVERYLSDYHSTVHAVAVVLTLIQPRDAADLPAPSRDPTTQEIVRFPVMPPRLDLARLGDLLTDPVGTLKSHYLGPGGLATAADAEAAAQRLFAAVDELLLELGTGLYRPEPSTITTTVWGPDGADLARSSALVFVPFDAEADIGLGAVLSLLAAGQGGPGLSVTPFGTFELSRDVAGWNIDVTGQATVDGALIDASGVQIVVPGGTSTSAQLGVEVTLSKLAGPSGAAFLVGSATGTRLEVGEFSISGRLLVGAGARDYGFEAGADDAAVVLSTKEVDGFLKSVLPPDDIRAAFELGLGWSHTRGLYFRGSAGIDVTLPVHVSLAGVFTLDSVFLALRLAQTGEITSVVAASVTIKLGPLTAVVERIGLQATTTFPQGGGNLGPAQVVVGFKPPAGAGLSLGAGPVGGGGYLYFHPDDQQYAGAAQLDAKALSLSAVGLLTTKLPDNKPGFSLLVIISAEFPPIQLGFGFALNGVGGLLGVNRTVNRDALAAGLKDGSLDSVRMPHDVVANAPKIISDLRASFPPAPGQFLLGPMVAVSWGTPPVVRLDLGLILELPSPLRLFVLGKLTVALPVEEAPVVLLILDVLGELDLDQRRARMIGSFRDSRVATFPVTGDMAMLATWDANPTFALAAGGFNPRFSQRPPRFPELARIAIALADGDNPRLRLEAYLAVTPASLQVGARLELYAAKDLGVLGKFELSGHFSFDVLMRLPELALVADLSAHLTLLRDGSAFCAVSLDATLTGPSPWHAWGKASFKVLGIEKSVHFDVSIGEPAPPPALPPVKVDDLLRGALTDRRNWGAALPSDAGTLAKLRPLPTGATNLLVHSLGTLTVRQRVAPLKVDLETFGAAPIDGPRRFEIEKAALADGSDVTGPGVGDVFAPGDFLSLSNDEKLSRPAFETMAAGVTVAGAALTGGARTQTNFGYRTIVVDQPDEQRERTLTDLSHLSPAASTQMAAHGAAARGDLRNSGEALYAGPSQAVTISDPVYALASNDTLATQSGVAATTYTEADAARRKADAGAPSGRAAVQVVGAQEVLA